MNSPSIQKNNGCCGKICCGLFIGVMLLLVGISALVFLPLAINPLVISNVILNNGTHTFEQFVKPTLTVRMQFWVMHITNAQEVLEGSGKPFLEEIGPFTYQEVRQKYDMVYNSERDTWTYKQNRTYYFLHNESIANDDFNFTTINLPLITLFNGFRYQLSTLNKLIAFLLPFFPNEKLIQSVSVHDQIWGYRDPLLALGHKYFPHLIYTDFVGALAGTNATYDGVYEVVAGMKNPSFLGQILSFNGTNTLPNFWSDPWTNIINGSDGTLCPPFVNKSSVLYSFVSDICRTIYGIYYDDLGNSHGVPLWRFTGPEIEYANASINVKNSGYCTPAGNCLPSGLFNLTRCKMIDGFHVPIIASSPHFLYGSNELKDSVDGLSLANVEEHATWINIEPLSGIILQIQKRLQTNVYLDTIAGFENLGTPRSVYLPVFWVNESAIADSELSNQLYSMLLLPLLAVKIVLLSLSIIGGLLLMAVFGFWIRRHTEKYVTLVDMEPHESFTPPGVSKYNVNVDN